MSLVVDVDLNKFKLTMAQDPSFWFTETKDSWIMVKPFPEFIIRTIVGKEEDEAKNAAFVARNLNSHTAHYCLGFSVDGVPMMSNVMQEQKEEAPKDGVKENKGVEELDYAGGVTKTDDE